ncbi:hypothetical protein [Streptomyces uncialis]|uniref:hypothetical protein n=1 Tax=Streptomyces uncialis TaxID=1048205 RepID=UPI00386F204D|nr:hypothetical protein OG924_29860 [Streptomyces uncialis]
MFKRIRDNREWREAQNAGQAMMEWAHRQQFPEPSAAQPEPAPAADSASSPVAAPVVDDFLPPDLLSASSAGVTGMMMPWRRPLVVDGEVRECPQCGAYRNWVLLAMGNNVWRRCREGHETLDPDLDTAWFNRHSGPMEHNFGSLQEGLRHLGH